MTRKHDSKGGEFLRGALKKSNHAGVQLAPKGLPKQITISDEDLDRMLDDNTPTVDGSRFMLEQQSEEDFQTAIVQLARMRGWRVYHTKDSRKSAQGFPDLFLLRAGQIVVAELKKEIPIGASASTIRSLTPAAAQADWLAGFGLVTEMIATALYLAEHPGNEPGTLDVFDTFKERARRLVAAYLWRPSNWPEIEKVLE